MMKSIYIFVHLIPMANNCDVYNLLFVINIVNNTIVTNSNSPEPVSTSQLFASMRSGSIRKLFDFLKNPNSYAGVKFFEFFSCGTCKNNRIVRISADHVKRSVFLRSRVTLGVLFCVFQQLQHPRNLPRYHHTYQDRLELLSFCPDRSLHIEYHSR